MENGIVIIVPFHNISKYIRQCYDSLSQQYYSNFQIVFADDNSTDHSLDLIPDAANIVKIRNTKNLMALQNIYNALCVVQPRSEDIVVIVDGDDYLAHDQVLYNINNLYNDHQCLITYGQYCTTTGEMGHCAPYSREEFSKIREIDWRASHLKTFKYSLFEAFLRQDPGLSAYKGPDGEFFRMTYDMALMYPLLEIAGYDKTVFNSEVVYLYRLHELNDHWINRDHQFECAQHILAKPPFTQAF